MKQFWQQNGGQRVVNLIERLMDELGVTREQAEGGAGLLLGFAQKRLGQDQFLEVADTIPAISDIIGKAPRCNVPAPRTLRALLSRWCGGLGGLYVLVKPFGRLGLGKSMLVRFVDSLTTFFREQGGEKIKAYLKSVLR